MYDLSGRDSLDLVLVMDLSLSSSVWGADVKSDYIILSDNSQKVSIFYFEEDVMYFGESLQFIHNVPDVVITFIQGTTLQASCISISGELVNIEFTRLDCVGLPICRSSSETIKFSTIKFIEDGNEKHFRSSVLHRAQLQEHGWTVNCIEDKWFKEVSDTRLLGTRASVDTLKILQSSKILGLSSNHLITSDLGGAADFEILHITTKFDSDTRMVNRLNSFSDKLNRIKKRFFKTASEDECLMPSNFVVVTTASKVGLYRTEDFICNADTGDLFEFDLPEELEFSNRLSISKIIPELSAVVVISQAGFLTIFRLVKHRGLHSLREEINFQDDYFTSVNTDTITGLGVRRIESGTFWLYLSYSDGKILKLELSHQDKIDDLEIALL